MRKVVGIGETILDILFKDGQPVMAVPGGSVFNAMVTLGRLNVPNSFVSEIGTDKVGVMLLDFMHVNGIETQSVESFLDGKSPVSLAFLDAENNSEYLFYQQYPEKRLNVTWPQINEDDILLISSFYCINPAIRPRLAEFLDYARSRKAIIYYDLNFRKPHQKDILKVMPAIIENLEYADIVRGSTEDFEILFGLSDADTIYKNKIKFYSREFICTQGKGGVDIFSSTTRKHYPSCPTDTVSTIGAGDNFNAGIVFALLHMSITREELPHLTEKRWDEIIQCGIHFATQVCTTLDNYISNEFAQEYLTTLK